MYNSEPKSAHTCSTKRSGNHWCHSWIRGFENNIQAMSESDLPEARKHVFLIHCLSTGGQRLFYTLTVSDEKYDTALEASFFYTESEGCSWTLPLQTSWTAPGWDYRWVCGCFKIARYNMPVSGYWRGNDSGPTLWKDEFNAKLKLWRLKPCAPEQHRVLCTPFRWKDHSTASLRKVNVAYTHLNRQHRGKHAADAALLSILLSSRDALQRMCSHL